jgi:sialate O-acetylesterase
VRGVLWYQGEGDTGPELGDTYEARFGAWVASLRADLGDPALCVIAAQICRYDLPQLKRVLNLDVDPAETPGWSAVREALRRAGDALPGVSVVATADLGLIDGIHLDFAAQDKLGRRMAAVALGRRSPRLAAVERVGDGSLVACRFDHVAEGLSIDGPCDIVVGCSPARSVQVAGRDTVVVESSRPVAPDDTVTYGPGLNPRAGLHDGLLAVPLFGPVAIAWQ